MDLVDVMTMMAVNEMTAARAASIRKGKKEEGLIHKAKTVKTDKTKPDRGTNSEALFDQVQPASR